jgi:hypothetical protein
VPPRYSGLLKIVVSPVRVRVSPSQESPVIRVFLSPRASGRRRPREAFCAFVAQSVAQSAASREAIRAAYRRGYFAGRASQRRGLQPSPLCGVELGGQLAVVLKQGGEQVGQQARWRPYRVAVVVVPAGERFGAVLARARCSPAQRGSRDAAAGRSRRASYRLTTYARSPRCWPTCSTPEAWSPRQPLDRVVICPLRSGAMTCRGFRGESGRLMW